MTSNFVDYVKIFCRSGKGGAGSLHFRREKYIPKGGPDGGDGGRGGNVILRGNAQLWTLLHLRYTKHLYAGDGVPGGKNQLTGAAGNDIYIDVPLGTVAYRSEDHTMMGEITEDKQEVVLLKGGRGGKGNAFFKTATLQAPKFAQPGEPNQEEWITLELKLLADVGLVGFPNAGKSTLFQSFRQPSLRLPIILSPLWCPISASSAIADIAVSLWLISRASLKARQKAKD